MASAAVFDYRGEYDENWPLPKELTLEQYRRVFFRPDAHFVDGRSFLAPWVTVPTARRLVLSSAAFARQH